MCPAVDPNTVEAISSDRIDNSPTKLEFRYQNLRLKRVPKAYIQLDEAIDRVGCTIFEDWGTREAFNHLPFRLIDGVISKMIISGRKKNGKYMTSIEHLPESMQTPDAKIVAKQFDRARKEIIEALDTGDIVAFYRDDQDKFAEIGAAYWSSRFYEPFMLGLRLGRSKRRIFMLRERFDAWLLERNSVALRTRGTRPAPTAIDSVIQTAILASYGTSIMLLTKPALRRLIEGIAQESPWKKISKDRANLIWRKIFPENKESGRIGNNDRILADDLEMKASIMIREQLMKMVDKQK